MSIPNVSFETTNGNLGGSDPLEDGVVAMVLSHAATADLPLNTPKAIFSLSEAKALGITGFALEEITDFYSKTGDGQELWISIVSNATTISSICDGVNDIAKALLVASKGRVRMWGVNIEPADSYTPDVSEGVDKDCLDAVIKANALCELLAEQIQMPTRAVLPARYWNGDVADLRDLKTMTNNKVQLSLLGNKDSKSAKVGFVLGMYSSMAVQRCIGRVADGDIGLTEAYLTDGITTAESIALKVNTIHDKGYLFPLTRVGRAGYYLNDDPMCASNSDDFCSMSNGRVMDKVQRIAYDVYLDFVNDDYAVDADGNIGIEELKRLQGKIDDNVNQIMVSGGEISGFASEVPAGQDVLGTGITRVILNVQPKAYHKQIVVEQGFTKTL